MTDLRSIAAALRKHWELPDKITSLKLEVDVGHMPVLTIQALVEPEVISDICDAVGQAYELHPRDEEP